MNTADPLVSVIMPAYNAARFIERAIGSVISQTFQSWELIVVDDGSTDDTQSIVRDIARTDDRIRLLTQPNAGVASARNLAIQRSNGRFIAPLDSDDFWFPRKLDYQVATISKSENIGLVYTWWVSIDETDMVRGSATGWNATGKVAESLLFINFIGNASVPLFRKSALDKVGLYNSAFRESDGEGCEDWDITLRIAEHFDVEMTPFYLTGYRAVGSSMSSNATQMVRSYELMIADLRNRREEVDDSVVRWSRSRFYSYIASQAYNARRPTEALRWLAEVFALDPLVVTSPGIIKLAGKAATRSLIRLVSHDYWPTASDITDFIPVTFSRTDLPTLDQLVSDITARARSRAWYPWKPYDLVLMHRWRKLAGVDPPSTK